MASAQVVKMSVTNNSPSEDSNHPDDLSIKVLPAVLLLNCSILQKGWICICTVSTILIAFHSSNYNMTTSISFGSFIAFFTFCLCIEHNLWQDYLQCSCECWWKVLNLFFYFWGSYCIPSGNSNSIIGDISFLVSQQKATILISSHAIFSTSQASIMLLWYRHTNYRKEHF